MKAILNGWISPEGEIFECEKMGHMDIAVDIAVEKGLIESGEDIDYHDMIQKHKYIKFFNACDHPHFDIFFVLNASCNSPKIEPAKKQILAMGRLEKALKKFREEK